MTRRIAQVSLVLRVPLPPGITARKAKAWLEGYARRGALPLGTDLIYTEGLVVSEGKTK